MPRTPQEQMAMAPEVFKFTRDFGRGQQVQEKPSVIQQIAGTLGNVALAGAGIAGAYGLARALGPQTDISPVSTAATSDVGEPTRVGQPGFERIPTKREETTKPKENFVYHRDYEGNKSGNYGNQVGTVGSLQGGQDEILGKLQRQQEMSEAGDKALDQVENMMGMGNIPPDVRESLKEEAFGAVDNNDFVNEFISQLVTDGEINNSMPTSELSEVYSNLSDAASDPDFKEGYNRIAENLNSIQETPVKNPRSNRFEKIRRQEEERADLDYIMSGGAALDQAFEEAVARDDMRDERVAAAIVEGPETVIQPANEPKGFLNAFSQEVKDFDHNIPWGERVDQAASSDSALGAAGIMAGTVAEKGAKDVGTRVKKIVTGVPQSINTVKNIASDIGETVTKEIINSSIIPDNQMQPSKWAEAARLAAGFPALGGSGGVEIGNESDLSDNAQFDDPQQQNEQITPAGINRQTSGLAPDPVEGEMQTISQAVNDLAASFGQGLAHLSPDERVDIARKMIEKDLRKDGYQGPINFG
jgi:hypothetical protein